MPQATTTRRPRRLRAAVRMTAIAAIIAGSAAAVYAERGTIATGLAPFSRPGIGWVIAGFAAQCLSMAAFALLQQRPLSAAGARLTFTSLLAIGYTSSAITLAVPVAGSGVAAAYTQREFRALGADTAAASLALAITGVISTVAFAVIAAAGAVLSGNPAAAIAGLVTSLCTAAATAVIVIILRSPRGRIRLRRPAASGIRLCQRLTHRPAGDPADKAAAWLSRLGAVSLGPGAIASAFGWALVNWAADVLCLAAAIAAVGAGVPWQKLVLAWSVGSAAASLSPTPYGLGIVDIALIAALHGTGLAAPGAVGAVLLYRVISFKVMVTLLWIGYRYLHDRSSAARHQCPKASPAHTAMRAATPAARTQKGPIRAWRRARKTALVIGRDPPPGGQGDRSQATPGSRHKSARG